TLKQVYHAHSAIVMPGSGTFGMEAVARQFATGKPCLVLRNGWFSFRWTQILETGSIPSSTTILMARPEDDSAQAAYAPAPHADIGGPSEVTPPASIFAPHVETASGIMLPDDHMRQVSDAVHSVGGLFVLDCIASGTIWVDMEKTGTDILISAPQKGWSGS